MWVLRFMNGVTSAGIAVTDACARELRLADGAPAWSRFLTRFRSIAEQFADAEEVRPFVYSPRLPYRCSVASGAGWALLPSSAAFVDPLFSNGIPLTLLGIERLGDLLAHEWGQASLAAGLREYGELTLADADWTARLIAACYTAFPDFPRFAAFSMFYFAAASFSEMARRLERRHLARRFLAADHPEFAAGLSQCAASLFRSARGMNDERADSFLQIVSERIAALNIAGLCDPRKQNWYGVDLEDLVHGADKLGLTPSAVRRILETAPWAQEAQRAPPLP
jgi:FADH2 O2-dependent halogenase